MRKTDEQTARELLRELENSPLVQEIKSLKAQEAQAQRTEWADQIEALEAEKSETLPDLQEKHKEALEVVKSAQDALREAERNASLAYHDEWRLANRIDSQIKFLKGELLANYDPAIDEAIEFFREEHERVRKVSATTYGAAEEVNLISLEQQYSRETNYPAICARLAYCRESIKLLEECKLVPEYDPELFVRLKADLPSLDDLTEYRAERPVLRDIPDMARAKIDAIIHDADFPFFIKKVNDFLKRPTKVAAPKVKAKRADLLFDLPSKPAAKRIDPKKQKALEAHRQAEADYSKRRPGLEYR